MGCLGVASLAIFGVSLGSDLWPLVDERDIQDGAWLRLGRGGQMLAPS